MNSKPKIGIMTYYAVQNFGAALQAFALQQNVERLGAKVKLIRYFDKHNESTGSKKNSVLSLLLKNKQLQNNLLHFSRFVRIKRFTKPNSIGFANFQKEYLHSSVEPYYEYEDLKMANQRYCGFVSGSDMVWTPIGQNLAAYFLQFADKEKRFSYAPSMTGCDTYSKEDADNLKRYLNGMNIISCREQEGVDYVRKTTGRDATLVVDPTLLFSKEDWRKELNITSQKPAKTYILCYNFGGLPKKIEQEVYRIAKEKNMDVRYVPLCHKESDFELSLGHHGPYGPREFVELFLNASFCVTNTFHGFLFSLISENPFVVVHREKDNVWKRNETRISNLMDILGVSDRYIEPDVDVQEKFLTLDYTKVNEKVAERRQASLAYLKNVVETACKNGMATINTTITNVRDLSIKQCTGCGLCSSVCLYDAIRMVENEEGFIVPQVDNDKCKECGKCAKSCPSIHPLQKNYPLDTKLCLSKDKMIDKSASGGLFITIARYYIEQLKGVVYGVVMDTDFTCHHAEATSLEELVPMQNSKYVQSIVGDCYAKAKQRLEEGRQVLFTGTPCQITALKSYLKKDYENLFTMDVVCHGVPNQAFWKIYVENYQKKGPITSYTFRNRANKNTWDPASKVPQRSTLEATIVAPWGVEHVLAQQDPFYGPFVRCESYRMSCYYCQYACKERVSDITMGDCDTDKLYPEFYPYESKSIALLNTEKGMQMWATVQDVFKHIALDYKEEVAANTCLRHPSDMPPARKLFYKHLYAIPWEEFVGKNVKKPSVLSKLKGFLKRILNKR